jgi:putative oxidoreductase
VNTTAKQERETAAGALMAESSASDRAYPFVTLSTALALLRIGTAALFMAHAVVRVLIPGSIQQFGGALGRMGIPQGIAVVYAITIYEITAGLLMVLGFRTRYLAAGFGVILLGGIVLIHRRFGWFVGEHGTGGNEYSVALLLALLVIAAADTQRADGARLVPH